MNKEEILAMEAGKGLDVLVADKVMGWETSKTYNPTIAFDYMWWTGHDYRYPDEWSPSTDISAAWEVVNSVKTKGYRVNLNIASKNSGGVINGIAEEGDWHCNVLGDGGDANHVYAKTAPEAISKAALLAVME